jgi:hypothetical protein
MPTSNHSIPTSPASISLLESLVDYASSICSANNRMTDQNTSLESLSSEGGANSSSKSPPNAVASFQAVLSSADIELTNEEIEIEPDPQLRKRMSLVEDQLTAIFEGQSELNSQVPVPMPAMVTVTNDPRSEDESSFPIHKMHAYPCRDTHKALPTNPSRWPQAPVMLRPTPNTNTTIRGASSP